MSCRRELVSQIIAAQYQAASNAPLMSNTSYAHSISKNCTVNHCHSFTRRHTRVYPTLYQHSVKWSPFLQTASRLSGPEKVREAECRCSKCTNSQSPSKGEDYGSDKENRCTLDYSVTTTMNSPFTQRYSDGKNEDSDQKFDTRLHPEKEVGNPLTFANNFDVLYAHKNTTTRDRITKCNQNTMTVGFEISDAACGPSAGVWSTRNRSSRTSRTSRATGQTIRFAHQTPCRTTTPSRACSRACSRASSETSRSSRASSRDRSERRRKNNRRSLISRHGYDRKQDKYKYSEHERSHGRSHHCKRWYEPERDPGPGSATRTKCGPGMECMKEYSPPATRIRSPKMYCSRVNHSRPTQPEDSQDSSGRRVLYNEGISDDVLKEWPNFKENDREVTPRAWDRDESRHRSESKVLKTQGCGPPCGETYIPFSQYSPSKYHEECKRENTSRHHKADIYRPPSPTSYHPSTPYHRSLPCPSCSLTRLTPAPRKVLASEQNVECFASMLGGEGNWSLGRNPPAVGWKYDP